MRKVVRYEANEDYWDRRWAEAGQDSDRFTDMTIYPIKYAEMVMKDPSQHAVELGVGLGRVLKHYRSAGFDIVGMERSEVAVEQLRSEALGLDVKAGDVRDLPYTDAEFDVVLCFGVYHNFENGVVKALTETSRIIKKGGRFCVSFRPDNFEMRFNEWYWRWRQRSRRGSPLHFHRWLAGEREFREMLAKEGLIADATYRGRNVSLLYRLPFLRARIRTEAERRAGGYKLNWAGKMLDRLLVTVMPSQFCNVLVFVGHKKEQ